MEEIKVYEKLKLINELLEYIELNYYFHVGETEFEDGILYVRDGWLCYKDEETIFKYSDIVDVRYHKIDFDNDDVFFDERNYVRVLFITGDELFFCIDADNNAWNYMTVCEPYDAPDYPCNIIEEDAVLRYLTTGKSQFEFRIDISVESYDSIMSGKQKYIITDKEIYKGDKLLLFCRENNLTITAMVSYREKYCNRAKIAKLDDDIKESRYGSKDTDEAYKNYLQMCGFNSEEEFKKQNFNAELLKGGAPLLRIVLFKNQV